MPNYVNEMSKHGYDINNTVLSTAAQNEVRFTSTESPESLAFLIKNTVTVDYTLLPVEENIDDKTQTITYYSK